MTTLTTAELEAMDQRFRISERNFVIAKLRRSVARQQTETAKPLGKGAVRIASAVQSKSLMGNQSQIGHEPSRFALQAFYDGLAAQAAREAAR